MSTWGRMRPTRRGVVVAAVAAVGVALGLSFGPRSLNAVVVPCLVALVAAMIQVRFRAAPTVTRSLPPDGFPREEGTVRLSLATDDPYPAVVADRLSPGLDGEARAETVVGSGGVRYDVRYAARGEQTVGPLDVYVRDVLGLVERRLTAPGTRTLLVYPTVRTLPETVRTRLSTEFVAAERPGRGEFESLREYVRGDPLRDVHWKSSAKRDTLVVQEFAAESDSATVTVAASADRGRADAMAEATASLVDALLGEGVPVSLTTPAGRVDADAGDRRTVLEHLARADVGSVADENADVYVDARDDATHVRIGGRETTFERLLAGEQP